MRSPLLSHLEYPQRTRHAAGLPANASLASLIELEEERDRRQGSVRGIHTM